MLPDGYVGVIVADTRRALQWEAGLRAAGFDVARVETTGRDADKGAWNIGVPRAQEREAKALVTGVIRGDRRLPSRPLLPPRAWIGLVAIAVVVTVLVLAALAD